MLSKGSGLNCGTIAALECGGDWDFDFDFSFSSGSVCNFSVTCTRSCNFWVALAPLANLGSVGTWNITVSEKFVEKLIPENRVKHNQNTHTRTHKDG